MKRMAIVAIASLAMLFTAALAQSGTESSTMPTTGTPQESDNSQAAVKRRGRSRRNLQREADELGRENGDLAKRHGTGHQ